MSRCKFHTGEFAEVLLRSRDTDHEYHQHLLNDYEFDGEWCYPIIDRDRGPKQREDKTNANLL